MKILKLFQKFQFKMHKAIISELESPDMDTSYYIPHDDTFSWLQSLRIFRGSQDDLPQKFIDGTLLCNLIHRLEGKSCKLGFHSHPKTLSACRTNIKKALEYLRSLSKLKSEFLWSYEEIIHGDAGVIWGLLKDLKKFYVCKHDTKTGWSRATRTNSVPLRFNDNSDKGLKETVKNWLGELGFMYLLEFKHKNYLKDPMRNGVMLCKVMGKLTEPFEFFSHPRNGEEVWENINGCMWAMKNTIKIGKISELVEEEPVWQLLFKIMTTFKPQTKVELPYSPYEIKSLKHTAFKWVYTLKIFDQNFPENFKSLVVSMKSGVVLSKILEKILKVPIYYIKFPASPKDCLENIENCLLLLQKQENMSKGFLFDSSEILKCNETYVLALLEDLHRFSSGLPPRRIGESYHSDGPYYGKFSSDLINFSPSDTKSLWKTSSIFMSPSRNQSINKIFNVSRTDSPISFHTYSNLKNSLEASLDNISPKQKPKKHENINGFEWIKKIKAKLPEGLDLMAEKVSEFRTGQLLCEILKILEAKSIQGVQKAKKKSGEAAKNVALAFEILRKKPAFSGKLQNAEAQILAGSGFYIRLLLKEIYKIYQNTIITLIKFNRT